MAVHWIIEGSLGPSVWCFLSFLHLCFVQTRPTELNESASDSSLHCALSFLLLSPGTVVQVADGTPRSGNME